MMNRPNVGRGVLDMRSKTSRCQLVRHEATMPYKSRASQERHKCIQRGLFRRPCDFFDLNIIRDFHHYT